jgi:hypothetical protein
MGKLMRVSLGRAFLVAVDIRKGSPTLGQWAGVEASVVFYLTHPEIAYREPIDPEIVILACCAVTHLRRRKETTIPLDSDVRDSSAVPEYLLTR